MVVSPGSMYGPSGEGFFRISLTTPDERLTEAVERLREHLDLSHDRHEPAAGYETFRPRDVLAIAHKGDRLEVWTRGQGGRFKPLRPLTDSDN